tara:strand:+ start:67 stop:642 length:576 start_codon:yes stop_codon:yes gene_type:complete
MNVEENRGLGQRPSWQQSMLRVKDAKASLDFYQNKLGMTLIDKYDFAKWKFSLYFLVSLQPGEKYELTPGTPEAHRYLWATDKVALELTHNWGSETDKDFSYHPGNAEKDGLPEKAMSLFNDLSQQFPCVYDEQGSIGKRYYRQDEAGTPFGITLDHDTLEDNSVTIRERDSMKQTRIPIDKIATFISENK